MKITYKEIPLVVENAMLVLNDYFNSDIGFKMSFTDYGIGVETAQILDDDNYPADSYIISLREFIVSYDEEDKKYIQEVVTEY